MARLVLGVTVAAVDQVGSLIEAAGSGVAGRSLPSPVRDGPPPGRTRDVVVGALFEGFDRIGEATERLGSVVSPWSRWIWRSPVNGPVRRVVEDRLAVYADRGAREQREGRDLVSGVVDGAVARVASSDRLPVAVDQVVGSVLPGILDSALPVAIGKLGDRPELIGGLVDGILDGILDSALPVAIDKLGDRPELIGGLVDGILDGILDSALPVAIDKLADDPDRLMPVVMSILPGVLDAALPVAIDAMADQQEAIREIVRSSSDRITTDMANTVRARTVRGDDVVERVVRRLTLRRSRPAIAASSLAPWSLDAASPVAELETGDRDGAS